MVTIDTMLLAKPTETIQTHTKNVVNVASFILENLSSFLERLTKHLGDTFFITLSNRIQEVKDFILKVVEYHDYGKINPSFQLYVKGFPQETEQRQHSIFSFFLWLASERKYTMPNETFFARTMIAYAAIVGHHGQMKEIRPGLLEKEIKSIAKQIDLIREWNVFTEEEQEEIKETIEDFEGEESTGHTDMYLTFAKFTFSVLVISDSIASSHIQPDDYYVAVQSLLFRDINQTSFQQKLEQSPIVQTVQSSLLSEHQSFSLAENMQDLRILLNKKSMAAWDETKDIYILEAPVGTGKTMSSLSLANLILHHERKRKLISVFPLNSVQTQYVETITEKMNVDSSTVNVINSESLFSLVHHEYADSFFIDSSNLWLFERNCFSNELIITSHVRFFSTFTSIQRKHALGFLSLIDSVVIIDEFQNYPTHYWFGIWDELLKLSELFGTKWIFTTGTFPVSQKQLTNQYKERIKKVLTPNENNELFSSPYVKNRCHISLLDTAPYRDFQLLATHIIEDIWRQEQKGKRQFILCVSFVKHAKALHYLLSTKLKGYICYFLCGRHSVPYKKELMKIIEHHNKHTNNHVLLVTTKTVECGMDFDFDFGYKEFDMFDSVEQLSGRVNRSNEKEDGGVKVFQIIRKKEEHEKFYYYNERVLQKLQQKEFIQLYEDLYRYNQISLSEYGKGWLSINQLCEFEKYKERLTVIDDQDYCTDILWVHKKQEKAFLDLLLSRPQPESYAEMMKESLLLRKELEPYRMTVTTKWLNARIDHELFEQEIRGITYYLVQSEEEIAPYIERYELNGIVSYLETNEHEVVEWY